MPFVDPDSEIAILSNLIRNKVFDILRDKQYLNWPKCQGQRQVKELNQGCLSVRRKEHCKLNKSGIREIVGLLTGYCPLRRHPIIMNVKNYHTCRDCYDRADIVMYVLCEYEAYSAYRFEHFGRNLLEPGELHIVPMFVVF